jgi:hypothetical protein
MKTQRGEVFGRILLGDNRRWSGHAANDQFVVCWNQDFSWTSYVCVCSWPYVYARPSGTQLLSKSRRVCKLARRGSIIEACFWLAFSSKTENTDLMTRSHHVFCEMFTFFLLWVRVYVISTFGALSVNLMPFGANPTPWSPHMSIVINNNMTDGRSSDVGATTLLEGHEIVYCSRCLKNPIKLSNIFYHV